MGSWKVLFLLHIIDLPIHLRANGVLLSFTAMGTLFLVLILNWVRLVRTPLSHCLQGHPCTHSGVSLVHPVLGVQHHTRQNQH